MTAQETDGLNICSQLPKQRQTSETQTKTRPKGVFSGDRDEVLPNLAGLLE